MHFSQAETSVLLFEVEDLKLSVFLPEVSQLCTEDKISPVPFAHESLAGLLYLEGRPALPVFDLYSAIKTIPAPPSIPGAQVVVVDAPGGVVGLRMHRLVGTRQVGPHSQIKELIDSELSFLPEMLRPAFSLSGMFPDIGRFYFFSPPIFLSQIDMDVATRPNRV